MRDLPDLDVVLDRVQTVAEGVGRRTRLVGVVVLLAAAAAWAILLRTWAFDSVGGFLAWLPLLLALSVPGLVLRGFGERARRLGADVGQIAASAEVTLSAITTDTKAGIHRAGTGGIRSLLGSLRDLGRHGDEIRSLVADAAGTARIVSLPYLALVGAAILGAAVVLTLLLIGVVTLAL